MDNRQAYIDWKNKIVHFAQLQERNYDRIFWLSKIWAKYW
jgi:hypothetical protein